MTIQKLIVVIIFGFVGQLGCWAIMMIGQAVTTMDNALIFHAIGAPIIFAVISVIYFKKLNYTTPLQTAGIYFSYRSYKELTTTSYRSFKEILRWYAD